MKTITSCHEALVVALTLDYADQVARVRLRMLPPAPPDDVVFPIRLDRVDDVAELGVWLGDRVELSVNVTVRKKEKR